MVDDQPLAYICKACGKPQEALCQPSLCPDCGAKGGARDFPSQETVTSAEQNDRFRAVWNADFTIPGRIVATAGVAALGFEFMQSLMVAVMQFSDFTADNDPYGCRDFGIVTIPHEGKPIRVYWKIDLYDNDLQFGSEAPSDLAKTTRVMTLLLPSEY